MAGKRAALSLIKTSLAVVIAAFMVSCGGEKSGLGFRLPDGDVDLGRQAFVSHNCTQCHTVENETFANLPANNDLVVNLGGPVERVKTYGQLVTSIINPQHVVSTKYRQRFTDEEGNSLMSDFNEELTVAELIDIVAFLQSHYQLQRPEPAYYYYP